MPDYQLYVKKTGPWALGRSTNTRFPVGRCCSYVPDSTLLPLLWEIWLIYRR